MSPFDPPETQKSLKNCAWAAQGTLCKAEHRSCSINACLQKKMFLFEAVQHAKLLDIASPAGSLSLSRYEAEKRSMEVT